MTRELTVKTARRDEIVEITSEVQAAVDKSGVREGTCIVSVPHTTAAILINEPEPGYQHDLLKTLDRMVPWEGGYRHPDGNAAAHIKASLIGAAQTIPVESGRLRLGTYQAVFLCEFDGPRSRKVVVKVVEG
jgi:secondary thiamine-phosphate synthase enzyme